MKIWTYVVIASTAWMLTGCNVDATLENLNAISPIKFMDAKATGLISGSSQRGRTTDHSYYIQSSVGSFLSGNGEQKTVDGEYKIYTSVQGALISN